MGDLKHVQGLSDLHKRLKDFPDKLQKQALKGATGSAAKVVRDEAKNQFSSKWHSQSGRLLQNIVMKFIPEKSKDGKVTFYVLVRKITRRKITAAGKKVAGSIANLEGYAFYWRFLEFGTRFIAARPFMRPALQGKYGEAIQRFRESLKAWIDKHEGKLPK